MSANQELSKRCLFRTNGTGGGYEGHPHGLLNGPVAGFMQAYCGVFRLLLESVLLILSHLVSEPQGQVGSGSGWYGAQAASMDQLLNR